MEKQRSTDIPATSIKKTKIYEELAELYPLWRNTTLEEVGHERVETDFVLDLFNKKPGTIRSVIDLGGGVGLHSGLLLNAGYDVTLFDQSEKALSIARRNNPNLKLIQGTFENMNVDQQYDAAICMWSTMSYIFSEEGRRTFYDWQKNHIRKLVILDEANFYRYPKNFHKIYEGENDVNKLKVARDWELTEDYLKKTKFRYEVFDKRSGEQSIIEDAENEQYVAPERLRDYFGKEWKVEIYGDYDLNKTFDKSSSKRIIPVFSR